MNSLPFNLNEPQQRAAAHCGSHLLIIAGPGTGKTHTLTHRISEFAKSLRASQTMAAITFTNKAAQEMRERLTQKLKVPMANLFVGTFHQLCLKILKDNALLTGLPVDFEVADTKRIGELAKELWPEATGRARREKLDAVSRWKSSDWRAEPSAEAAAFNAGLRERGLIDFDDILLETMRLFEAHPEILQRFHATCAYIFVDEYQDINAIQRAFLKMIVGPKAFLTAIGDPNQAIYGFRGSDVKFFTQFAQDFPGAATISLLDNYRSSANLLAASAQVIAKDNSLRVPELVAKIYTEGRLSIYEAPTEKAEAEYVVHQIEKMIGGTSMFSQDSGRVGTNEDAQVSFGDIAVLYRLNSLRFPLEQALKRSGIPFQSSAVKTEEGDDICPERQEEAVVDHERVSLMTLHAAKGLEFTVVFIIGCEEKFLPLNLDRMSSPEDEERRLFYVGMTRAKQRLYLLRSRRRSLYGKSWESKPSAFLADIEEELKNYETNLLKQRRKTQEHQIELFK